MTCPGCVTNEPGQGAHMGEGGCLASPSPPPTPTVSQRKRKRVASEEAGVSEREANDAANKALRQDTERLTPEQAKKALESAIRNNDLPRICWLLHWGTFKDCAGDYIALAREEEVCAAVVHLLEVHSNTA